MADLFDDLKPGGTPAPVANQYERGRFLATPTELPDQMVGPISLMPAMGADIRAFHEKYSIDYSGEIRLLPADLSEFRVKFLFEEIHEFSSATEFTDELDALVDIAYVAVGAVYLHGIDFDAEVRHSFVKHIGDFTLHKRQRPRPTMRSAEVTRMMFQLSKYMSVERGYFDESIDALVYLAVYCQQCAAHRGLNFMEAWRRVQTANMAKVRVERAEDSKRGSGFDVVKPPGWTPPDHSDLVDGYTQET